MASLSPYSITLGATDYPVKYSGLLTYIEPYLTNLETFTFSGGNVGLGVTPSAWGASSSALQFGLGGAINSSNGTQAIIAANRYFSGGDKYINSLAASAYEQNAGAHRWYTAPSGTAGNAISFTQAMTLDASGNLLVGSTASTPQNTTAAAFGTGPVAGYGSTWMQIPNNAASSYKVLTFFRGSTEIGSVSYNGTGVNFNGTSDRRLKENIQPASDAGGVIAAIEIVQHDWKAGGHTRFGVIAQDLHAVAPEAVTPGDDGDEIEKTWGVDYSKLVPMLIKEIQSLRARVAALEAA